MEKNTDLEKIRRAPLSLEAERAVLGGIFIKPDIFIEVIEIISEEDFYRNSHKEIFSTMKELSIKDILIDPLLVVEKIKNRQNIPSDEIEKIIVEILSETSTVANILHYAQIIKEKSLMRKLGETANKILDLSYNGEDVENVLDKAESMIFKVAENRKGKDIFSISDIIGEEFKRLEELSKNPTTTVGIPSGFKNYDELTSGFQNSDLIILAARPAMGKTAFALNIALNAALKSKKHILLFSLEMGKSQLLQRLLAIESNLFLSKLKNGFLQEDEWIKLGIASSRLGNSQIKIADVPTLNVLDIRSMGRKLKAEKKLDMILIDYLQLIDSANKKSDNRQQEISEISRALKVLARELDIPIIALSQLSRAVETRSDRKPMLSDLRESGAIEQDADIVMFLYRDEYYNPETQNKGITEVIIGKHRNGPTGSVKLKFIPEYTKFADCYE